jgi:hypothetical protein
MLFLMSLVAACVRFHAHQVPALVRVAPCAGPPRSLADSLVARLPPRTGTMVPDDQWADWANDIPGGFAGFLYDSAQRPILMLTRPSAGDSAKHTLANRVKHFAIEQATVRQARWDFAQLVDWYNYLFPRLVPLGVTMGDKNEGLNRLEFGVKNEAARRKVKSALLALDVPCDLVVLSLHGPVVIN